MVEIKRKNEEEVILPSRPQKEDRYLKCPLCNNDYWSFIVEEGAISKVICSDCDFVFVWDEMLFNIKLVI